MNTPLKTTRRYEGFTITRVAKGHYTVHRAFCDTITLPHLRDAQLWIDLYWGRKILARWAA
jgi:hypothetical protein